MYQNVDIEMYDAEQADMDIEMTDTCKIIHQNEAEMQNLSHRIEQCNSCTNHFSELTILRCTCCHKFMCKRCFSKGYWIAYSSVKLFTFKIPNIHTGMKEMLTDAFDSVHYTCSFACSETLRNTHN